MTEPSAVVPSGPFSIEPLTGVLGAEIGGVDIGQPLDDHTVAALRAALNENHVLVFRDQSLTPEQQITHPAPNEVRLVAGGFEPIQDLQRVWRDIRSRQGVLVAGDDNWA